MNKNLLLGLTGFLWLVIIPAKAQLEKGTGYLGATVSFGGNNNKPSDDYVTSSNQLVFQPSLQMGKFTRDNRMFGIGVGSFFNISKTKTEHVGIKTKYVTNLNHHTLSPFVRQYKAINSRLAVFLHASLDLSYLRLKTQGDSDKKVEEGYAINFRVSPGITYWISPRFALESDINLFSLGLGYQDFQKSKSVKFNSAVTSDIPAYFSVRASWYLHKK